MSHRHLVIPFFLILAAACGGGSGNDAVDASPDARPAAVEAWDRDLIATHLTVDVSTHRATATITVAAATEPGASFEAGDLEITAVYDDVGPLEFDHHDAQLDVGVAAGDQPIAFSIDYGYQPHSDFDGADTDFTLLWPYYCGNLFPCKSEPADGLEISLALTGVPEGTTAVFPEDTVGDAPSYMIAWALGDYTYLDLGATTAGTQVGVWYLPGGHANAVAGTEHLRDAIDWYETTLGPYPFGDRVGAVSVDWGPGMYGGMEHHPFWHVATDAMYSDETQLHEAAHGWFGDGVRIACWEEFVLSEGTVTYLTARATEAVTGNATAVWSDYANRLNRIQAGSGNKIAWPAGCNQVDILADGLFSDAPYIKGAYFFRALEQRIGVEPLTAALATFYTDYREQAASMTDLLDTITAETGYDATDCALAWLRSETVPAEETCPAAD